MKNAIKSQPLTPAQLMVLQVVKEQYNEQDLDDLRKLLLEFNTHKMQQHLDETIVQRGYTSQDFETMLNGHQRKSR